MGRRNPFMTEVEGPVRHTRLLLNGQAILNYLAVQIGYITRDTNAKLAAAIGLPLDKGGNQSRRLNDALMALRDAGLIEVSYESPHPRKSPAGRAVRLSRMGLTYLGLDGPAV